MHEIDLKKFNIRSDLVVDLFNLDEDIEGVKVTKRNIKNTNIIDVELERDVLKLGKKKGKYITISFDDVTDTTNYQNVVTALSIELKEMLTYLKIGDNKKCLVIGLGNKDSTPDCLGPRVVDSVLVTKYLFDLSEVEVERGYRNVSSFVPGVTGVTGLESADVIKGIVKETKPDFLIVVDALLSSSIERINKTIQLTNTGISPGAGVMQNRKEVTEELLGIPVISLGVPTVIDLITIVKDTIKFMMRQFSYNKATINKSSRKLAPITSINYLSHEENLTDLEKEKLLGMVGNLDDDELKALIFEVLTPIGFNMIVTPKEVDFQIEKLSSLIASSINGALHKNKKINK